ncbi:hypothetical protein E2C01_025383 [Portunus trituberculatus]|uniref:Uncharacterized protein n=1 Tax=Portunus trituberculatus TaxID=210409 RepID=A0A5B7ECT6_PORTR|nr:hypothetical protein [Portunus trituberculatus]
MFQSSNSNNSREHCTSVKQQQHKCLATLTIIEGDSIHAENVGGRCPKLEFPGSCGWCTAGAVTLFSLLRAALYFTFHLVVLLILGLLWLWLHPPWDDRSVNYQDFYIISRRKLYRTQGASTCNLQRRDVWLTAPSLEVVSFRMSVPAIMGIMSHFGKRLTYACRKEEGGWC